MAQPGIPVTEGEKVMTKITKQVLRLGLMLPMLFLMACAKVALTCPPGQTVQATIAGQDFAAFTSALGAVVSSGVISTAGAAKAPMARMAPQPIHTGATSVGAVNVSTTTLGGPMSVTCADLATPATTVTPQPNPTP